MFLFLSLWLLCFISPLFIVEASLQLSDPKPKLSYSWQETEFDFSDILEWEDKVIVMEDSGNYSEVYNSIHYEYLHQYDKYIKENRTIYHTANYTSTIERRTSGNASIIMNMDAYQVNVNYGSGVKLLWIALKGGTMEYEYFLKKDIQSYTYYEENHRHIESHFEERDMDTDELTNEWTIIQDIPGEVNSTVSNKEEWSPFFRRLYWSAEIVKPLILTIQIFNTENNDKIAWAHLFQEFYIFKDTNLDNILTIHDNPDSTSLPTLTSGRELVGLINPYATKEYMETEDNESIYFRAWADRPSDTPFEEIISGFVFSPPTETSTANVSWGITYTDSPLYMAIFDFDKPVEEWYQTPVNATLAEMCPTNLSFGFDFILDEDTANLDITWEMDKLSDPEAYTAVQDYGLLIPQYNFFLSSFDIDEPEAPFLSVPRDTFSFISNDTLVAEINMGGSKKNYTLYNSTAGVEDVFPSAGGSIHKHVIQFTDENSFYDSPLVNMLFTLRDIVAQDTSFIVQDDLFSMETQNYPIWSGERIIHDPTLTIHHKETLESPIGVEEIPSYNLSLVLGLASVVITLLGIKYRKTGRTN